MPTTSTPCSVKNKQTDSNMKSYLSFAVLFLLSLGTAQTAQAQRFEPDKFNHDRAQFIVRQAQLSAEDSATFFSLYNDMQQRKRELHDKCKALPRTQPATEDSCRQVILGRDILDLQMKAVEQDYHARMLQVLSPSLVFRLLKAEDDFHRQAFRRAAKKVKE